MTQSLPPQLQEPGGEPSEFMAFEPRQFHLHACLGRGGFGEVYRATMVSAGGVRTEVAVKVMHADVDPDSQAVQRLRDEGRLLGAVRHPAVLRVYDLVVLGVKTSSSEPLEAPEREGRVALVTEYVEGQDLDKCIQGEDPPPMRAIVEIVAKVADALQSAWTTPAPGGEGPLQLVHRDIKPANLRLGRHGEVKLLDFGIARAANVEREAHTETNALLGSYLYMAPERFLEGVDSGPAIDVYALGLILFEGIVKRRLFGDKTLKELYLLTLDPDRYDAYIRSQLETIPKTVPYQIVAILTRTLDLDPSKRPDHETLARACHEIADRLPGATLDRWARGRSWPPPRVVRGVLDNTVITETAYSRTGTPPPARARNAQPLPLGTSRGTRSPKGSESGIVDLRTLTGTLDRPGVVAVAGVGLLGMLGAAAALVGLAAIGAVALWLSLRPPPVRDLTPEPEPVAQPGPVEPAPTAPGELVPVAQPEPVEPVPVEPAPATPRPARPTPVPQPVVQPEPTPRPEPVRPAPSSEMATVTVEGGKMGAVVVQFVGKDRTYTAGRIPAGTYEIRARFDDEAAASPKGKLFLNPGERATVKCGKLKRTCEVIK